MKFFAAIIMVLFISSASYADREKKEEHPSIGNQYRGGVGSGGTGGTGPAAPGTPLPGSTTLRESNVGSFLPRFQSGGILFNVSPEAAAPNYACGKWDYPGSSGSRAVCLMQTTSRTPASRPTALMEVATSPDGPWTNQIVIPPGTTGYFRFSSTGATSCSLSNFANVTGTSLPPTAFTLDTPSETFSLTCVEQSSGETAQSQAIMYAGTAPTASPSPSPLTLPRLNAPGSFKAVYSGTGVNRVVSVTWADTNSSPGEWFTLVTVAPQGFNTRYYAVPANGSGIAIPAYNWAKTAPVGISAVIISHKPACQNSATRFENSPDLASCNIPSSDWAENSFPVSTSLPGLPK